MRRPSSLPHTALRAAPFVACLTALLALEQLSRPVRDYFVEHPMLVAAGTSMLLLGTTVLVVDEVVTARQARRWRPVAQAAYREMSTDAYKFYFVLLEHLGRDPLERQLEHARPILTDGFWTALEACLDAEAGRQSLRLLIYEHTENLGQVIARWAPVMLQTGSLADALTLFADMRDTLIMANRGFDAVDLDPNWRWGLLTSIDYFLLLFAHFDTARREVIGEPNIFGTTEAEYRSAWGIPDRPTPPDLLH